MSGSALDFLDPTMLDHPIVKYPLIALGIVVLWVFAWVLNEAPTVKVHDENSPRTGKPYLPFERRWIK